MHDFIKVMEAISLIKIVVLQDMAVWLIAPRIWERKVVLHFMTLWLLALRFW